MRLHPDHYTKYHEKAIHVRIPWQCETTWTTLSVKMCKYVLKIPCNLLPSFSLSCAASKHKITVVDKQYNIVGIPDDFPFLHLFITKI